MSFRARRGLIGSPLFDLRRRNHRHPPLDDARLLGGDLGDAGLVARPSAPPAAERVEERLGERPRVADDPRAHLPGQAQHAVVDVHLDDPGVLRPVVEPVLRQRPEGAEPGPDGEHDVGPVDQAHRRLRPHVPERTDAERVRVGERVVVEVGRGDRRREVLGQGADRFAGLGPDDASAGEDDGEPRARDELGGRPDLVRGTGPVRRVRRRVDLRLDLAVEVVARDVDLDGTVLRLGDVEGPSKQLGHPFGTVDLDLPPGDLREDRQLLRLLEAPQPDPQRPDRRGDHHHGRVRPVGGGDGGHEVGDARPVLADADGRPAGDAAPAVGHVRRVLLVGDRDEADPRAGKEVQCVHVGRAHDPRDGGDALGGEGLDEGLAGGHSGRSGRGDQSGRRLHRRHRRSSFRCAVVVNQPTALASRQRNQP